MKRVRVLIGVLLTVLIVPGMLASASGAQVTSGTFQTYAGGIPLGYEISGQAFMTRTADGKTLVSTHVEGLAGSTTYGVHVHNKACGNSNGGSHYQHDPNGGVNPVNEIWPAFTSTPAGIGNGFAVHAHTARAEAQSVVVHAPDGTRIACADLN
jgi:hypothetical protein